jgi:hypothetical protein
MEWKIEQPITDDSEYFYVRLDIPRSSDRETILYALGNSGYFSRLIVKKVPNKASTKYFVEVVLPKEA